MARRGRRERFLVVGGGRGDLRFMRGRCWVESGRGVGVIGEGWGGWGGWGGICVKAASGGDGSSVFASVVRRRAQRGRRKVGGRVGLGVGDWQNAARRLRESILGRVLLCLGFETRLLQL